MHDPDFIPCTARDYLPEHLRAEAAETAIRINPANRPRFLGLANIFASTAQLIKPTIQHLAVVTTKYWGKQVRLTVSFVDNPEPELQRKILNYMNAWGKYGDILFTLVPRGGQVRIARSEPAYYSYLGTDILHIPQHQHTMMLGGFTLRTSEREFTRVVKHETGHTLGFPHEHMRPELVNQLDIEKTVRYFQRTQGWSPQETMQQVLTPLNQSSIRGTPDADQDSIMCYQLPGDITKTGQPIRGGADINAIDAEFVGKLHPLPNQPPPSPPPPGPQAEGQIVFGVDMSKRLISIKAPDGWRAKPAAAEEQEHNMDTPSKALQLADQLEAELTTDVVEGAQAGIFTAIASVRKIIAAVKAGDMDAARQGVCELLCAEEASGGGTGISFQLAGRGINWKRLFEVLGELLPFILGVAS